jgi:tartrate dehydrogenase/decarboxylase/D-malate dehydrogenase
LTVVTKSNAQRHAMVMWDEIAVEIAREFPDVTWDKMLVDAMTVRMTLHPKSLDTIVATNLHADILSDLAGALAGSLGVAPTGNIDPQRRFPSMFEPIHGSAFDITGKGIANPVATFWTGAQRSTGRTCSPLLFPACGRGEEPTSASPEPAAVSPSRMQARAASGGAGR